MRKLILVFLCFFASNAYASSADSGRCPWKIPFTITISGVGATHGSGVGSTIWDDTSYLIPSSNEYYSVAIDTNSHYPIQYSLHGDTLRFNGPSPGYGLADSESVIIVFAPGHDSIISMLITDTFAYSDGWQSNTDITNFQISSLQFDDTSIFATDSSFIHHNISFTQKTLSTMGPYPDVNWRATAFTASSVTLYGISRSTTFSNQPSIVTEAPQPNNLAIFSSNCSIACSFDVSDQARNLEIFSPLGIREASFTVSPGQTGASLPHLGDGFYFVRLGGSLKKIYVAE